MPKESGFTRAVLRLSAAAALAGLVWALYGRAIRFGFVWDDYLFARPWSGAELLSTLWGTWEPHGCGNAHYRPVIALSLQLDYRLWGFYPPGFHATSLLIFGVMAFVGFEWLSTATRSRLAGFAGSLVWIAHPYSAAAATWSNQRTDSIMATFYLACLWALTIRPLTRRRALLACALAVLAIGSKEMAATLPVVAAMTVWMARTATTLSGTQVSEERRLGRVTLLALFLITTLYVLAWTRMFPSKTSVYLDDPASFIEFLLDVIWPGAYATTPQLKVSLLASALVGFGFWVFREQDPRLLRLFVLACVWPLLTAAPLLGLRAPAYERLGLLVAVSTGILAALFTAIVARRDRMLAVGFILGALLWLTPQAREASAAWGPGGWMHRNALRWNSADSYFMNCLTPEAQARFQRQLRRHLP